MKNLKNDILGFTLIELLIVVAVVGVMSGLALMIIDPGQQKRIAQDSVRANTIANLAEALDAHYVVEGTMPLDSNGDGNPFDGSNDPLLTYIREWPTIPGSDAYHYISGSYMCVSAQMATFNGYFKWLSPNANWTNHQGNPDCLGKVLKNCPITHGCDTDPNAFDMRPCFQPNGASCT